MSPLQLTFNVSRVNFLPFSSDWPFLSCPLSWPVVCLCNSDAQQRRCHICLLSVLCSLSHSELTTTSCQFSRLNLLKSFSSSCLWPLGLGCHLFQGAFSIPLELDGMSFGSPWPFMFSLYPFAFSGLSKGSKHLLFAWHPHV